MISNNENVPTGQVVKMGIEIAPEQRRTLFLSLHCVELLLAIQEARSKLPSQSQVRNWKRCEMSRAILGSQ